MVKNVHGTIVEIWREITRIRLTIVRITINICILTMSSLVAKRRKSANAKFMK